MKEFQAIIDAYKKIDFSQRKAALATVVKVRGSSYRSPGARMLIMDDGRWVGSISGGCLEGDALRKSRLVMMSEIPTTITYDTREESNQNLGIGLGCNGVIDVLLEPINRFQQNNPIQLFENIINNEEPVALATVFKALEGTSEKLLLTSKGEVIGSLHDAVLTKKVFNDLADLFESKKSEARKYSVKENEIEVFVELIQPTITVSIFGAGFDARPVSQLAKALGWKVVVTDECVAHLAPTFFPGADKLSLCHREVVDRDISVTSFTACILMSHNYEYDRDILKKLLLTETPYIGILGPRKRFEKIVEELRLKSTLLLAKDLHRIHSPIGLDIGAETPDEIAVSIIAEIQAKFSNRSGGFLKYRESPIHQRKNSDEVFKQVYLNEESSRSLTG